MTAVRRHGFAIGLILAVVLGVRVGWVIYVHPDPLAEGRFDDTAWYWASAHYFANGDGYVNPFTGTPTAAWPPGYSAFLGTVFYLFGEGVYQVAAANIALTLATIVVVYTISLRLFDRTVAIVAAGALALWPGQIYFSSLALSEALFTFLFALAALMLLCVPTARRWRAPLLVAFGVVVAAGALTRGQALVLIPIGVVVWTLASVQWKAAVGWGMLAALATCMVLAPWVIRNEHRLGSPVIIATNMGPNVWIGHNEHADGTMHVEGGALPQPDYAGLTQPEIEVAADRIALRKGLAYLFTHPKEETLLSARKVRALFGSDATALDWNSRFDDSYYGDERIAGALRDTANAFWFVSLILAGAGLLASRARLAGAALLLPIIVVAWTATHLLFFGDPRFHYPIVFAIAILAARGLVAVAEVAALPLPGGRKKGYAAA